MTAYNFSQLVPFSSYKPKFSPGMLYEIVFEYTLTGALANADTITTPSNAFPDNGIRIMGVLVTHPELDTNTTPTGTYNVGDSGDADRFIASAPLGVAGVTTTGFILNNPINVAQSLSNGVVATGSGYLYGSGTNPQLVLTVNAAVATGASSGVIRLLVTYYCEGEDQ
jgi:hypothetical protein